MRFLMYEWIKALHIIAVISWMAGMLYLPRLFVYHCEAGDGFETVRDFQDDGKAAPEGDHESGNDRGMGSRTVPDLGWTSILAKWFHGKLLLVVLLSGIHGFLAVHVRDFAVDRNTRSHNFYRIINEIPTILMIGIVILAVVKPF